MRFKLSLEEILKKEKKNELQHNIINYENEVAEREKDFRRIS